MQYIVTSLRPCRSQVQEAVTAAASRLFTFEAPQIGFLASKNLTAVPRTMQTAFKSSKTTSKSPQPETSEPKPDTPDDVAPEVTEGAAAIDDISGFNAREGGEGGPGRIPMKKKPVKEEVRQGQGSAKEGAAGEHMQKRGQQGDKQDGSMGPDTVGDTHRLDYSR